MSEGWGGEGGNRALGAFWKEVKEEEEEKVEVQVQVQVQGEGHKSNQKHTKMCCKITRQRTVRGHWRDTDTRTPGHFHRTLPPPTCLP